MLSVVDPMVSPAPNLGQISLVLGAAAVFFIGGIVTIIRLRSTRGAEQNNKLRLTAKSLAYIGVCVALAALIWRSVDRGNWMPLSDNFETLATLAVLLAGMALYLQRARPVPGLDWFLMPIVILLLLYAALFARVDPGTHDSSGIWDLAHRASSFAGAAAFGVAAAIGAMYLFISRRLRRKAAIASAPAVSLERLENLTYWSVSFGFALLTIGIITGVTKAIMTHGESSLGQHWLTSPKVILAFCVWLVYAVALHTPITPTVRGRKSALLSIVGFVLMVATLMTVAYMPAGR